MINMLAAIERVLEEKVRPHLLTHEGDVRIVGFEEGILRIRLTGQCSGCPSARITTEELIGNAVMMAIPDVRDVILVNEINPELLAFAKKILNHQVAK